MDTLDTDTIQQALQELDGWQLDDGRIVRELRFDEFRDAIAFINRVADLADEANHHPDLFNSYTTVRVALTTHSAGGVTDKDLGLAKEIDEVAAS